jgi:hypothetical protein
MVDGQRGFLLQFDDQVNVNGQTVGTGIRLEVGPLSAQMLIELGEAYVTRGRGGNVEVARVLPMRSNGGPT